MGRHPGTSARRVPVVVDESIIGGKPHDYADAFEVKTPDPDRRSAEDLARFALEHAPPGLAAMILIVHRHVLRFRLGPVSSPDHILGWKIVRREPDVVVLEAVSPLLRGLIVARKEDPTRVVVTTYVFHTRPLGRVLMAIVGPLHRRVAPFLLERTAAAGSAGQGTSRDAEESLTGR